MKLNTPIQVNGQRYDELSPRQLSVKALASLKQPVRTIADALPFVAACCGVSPAVIGELAADDFVRLLEEVKATVSRQAPAGARKALN